MWVEPVKTEYDRTDLFLSPVKMSGKRVCEYILNQEPLIKAQKTPEKYKNLRVRVSGFSDYFVSLNEPLQNEIISRTKHTS